MTPLLALTDRRMTLAFAVAMALLVLCLKAISTLHRRPPPGFWLTLLPSGDSFQRVKAVSPGDLSRAVGRCVIAALGFACLWLLCVAVTKLNGPSVLPLGWLAAPLVWLMGEVVGALARVLWLPSGRLLPHPHENIFAARSVADFWGRRWNVWMSDWFREIIFLPLRTRPVLAILAVFAVSGVIHEAVVSLGLWLIIGSNLFGTMIAYFGLQAAGVLVERKWLGGRPGLRRAFAWLVILGPAPLFVNEGILRAYWLWP